MPTFSSSVNKPGSKRVAPKAPTRRALRTTPLTNARSASRDTPSYNQSIHGTPERAGPEHALVNQAVINGVVAAPIEAQDDGSLRSLQLERSSIPRVERSPGNSLNTQRAHQIVADPEPASVTSARDNAQVGSSKGITGKADGKRTNKKAVTGQKDRIALGNGEGSSIASSLRSRKQKPTAKSTPASGTDGKVVDRASLSGAIEQGVAKPTRKRTSKRPPESQEQPTTKKRRTGATAAGKAANATAKASGKKRAPSKRQPRQRESSQQAGAENHDEDEPENGDEDAQVEAEPARKITKRRIQTRNAEEAQKHQISPKTIRLADLVKDSGLGKSSVREAEMEKIDWADVKKNRRAEDEERYQEDLRAKEARKKGNPLPKAGPHATERLVLVNGQIVVDEASRVIDRNAATARDADDHDDPITEDRLTKRVNQRTVGRKPSAIIRNAAWNAEETELFYQGLRMFGTDFMMISKLFPGTARSTIKKKYTKEERVNADKVSTALVNRERVDLDHFSKLTDTVYQDPQTFYEELEAEKVRIEAEDAKIRAEADAEAEADADADVDDAEEEEEVHPSIEQEEAPELPASDTEREAAGGKEAKKQSVAEAGKAEKKGSRKKQGKHSGKKDGKVGAKGLPAEGMEEMIGSIAEFNP